MTRRWVPVVLLALLAPSAAAAVILEHAREGSVTIPFGGEANVRVLLPFRLDAEGLFYAKLLVSPWNAVNSGVANGTLAPGDATGATGWWVSFTLRRNESDPGRPLGTFVDGRPTADVPLAAGEPHVLEAVIHVPEAATIPGQRHEVNLALAMRANYVANASGGQRDPSRAYTQYIYISTTQAAPLRPLAEAPARAAAGPEGAPRADPGVPTVTVGSPTPTTPGEDDAPLERTALQPTPDAPSRPGGTPSGHTHLPLYLLILLAFAMIAGLAWRHRRVGREVEALRGELERARLADPDAELRAFLESLVEPRPPAPSQDERLRDLMRETAGLFLLQEMREGRGPGARRRP